MNEESLKEQLEINTKLELLKEHKCCAESILCIETYMYRIELENRQLKEQLKQRDEIINEVIKFVEDYDFAHNNVLNFYNKVLNGLQKYKGDNNE